MNRRLSRRQALAALAGGVALSSGMRASGAASAAPSSPATSAANPLRPDRTEHFRSHLQRLADGVHAFVQIEAAGETNAWLANCGAIAGHSGLLAVDTTAAPDQAHAFIAAAEKATRRRFTDVLLTHAHPDHYMALQYFPRTAVIAQRNALALLKARFERPPPLAWPAMPGWARGTEKFRPRYPDRTFESEFWLPSFAAGGVRLFWPGRAHTAGDALALLPKERILFLGDVGVFGGTPAMAWGYPRDWIDACNRILELDVDVLVPGHGPIGGKRELAAMRDYLTFIRHEAKSHHDAGRSAGQAAAAIELGPYASWPDADRLVNNVVRCYDEIDGRTGIDANYAGQAQARADYLKALSSSAN